MIGHKVAQVLEINNEVIGTSRKTISATDLGINKATILNKDFIVDESLDFISRVGPFFILNFITPN